MENHMLDDIIYTKFLLVTSMNFFTCFYHTVANDRLR